MSLAFGAHCDDFHVASRLFLKLDLAPQRETVLHFFDSVRREFPGMRKLRRREDGAVILEEDGDDDGARRWIRLDNNTIRLGHHNPPSTEEARRLGRVVLEMAPYHLTLGQLDYDHLEVVYEFDLEYRGNHDQLVADALLGDSPLAGIFSHPDVLHTIDIQPFLGMAVSEQCDTQVYVEIKSRTSTFEVRTQQYEPQPLSVFLTVRRYWGFADTQTLHQAHEELTERADDWAIDRVLPMVVSPLAAAIASSP
ncbi:MAG: hypothetical protein O7D94_04265 [Planctomycetota bacterium]|nr:hypothetical protein [Planctomycetota bacterium]